VVAGSSQSMSNVIKNSPSLEDRHALKAVPLPPPRDPPLAFLQHVPRNLGEAAEITLEGRPQRLGARAKRKLGADSRLQARKTASSPLSRQLCSSNPLTWRQALSPAIAPSLAMTSDLPHRVDLPSGFAGAQTPGGGVHAADGRAPRRAEVAPQQRGNAIPG